MDAPDLSPDEAQALCSRIRSPVLVIHGDQDALNSITRGAALAEHTGGDLVVLEGSGHAPHIRDPVKVNLLIREFLEALP
jgi:pimeloyl-ACP methyl ester carboxylesterase